MKQLSSKLRIGEKIGLGFGLVGVIFLAVIWQYHDTLQRSLDDYQRLIEPNTTRGTIGLTDELPNVSGL